jgi:hypothetical protein
VEDDNEDDDSAAAVEIEVPPAAVRAVFCNSGGNSELTRAIICCTEGGATARSKSESTFRLKLAVVRVSSSFDDDEARLGGNGDMALMVGSRAVRGEGSAAVEDEGDMDMEGVRFMEAAPAIRFS